MSLIAALLTIFTTLQVGAESLPNVGRIYVGGSGKSALATQVGPDLILTTSSTIMSVRKNPDHQIFFSPNQRGFAEGDPTSVVSGQVIQIGSGLALIRLSHSLPWDRIEFSEVTEGPMVVLVKTPVDASAQRATFFQRMNGADLSVSFAYRSELAGAPFFQVQNGNWRLAGIIVSPTGDNKSSLAVSSETIATFLEKCAGY